MCCLGLCALSYLAAAAWSIPLTYTDQHFRVKKEELGQFADQKSLVELTDGSGFYVTVAVSHALHCVQRLHHYVYRDHYHPNLSGEDEFTLKIHTGMLETTTILVTQTCSELTRSQNTVWTG